MAIAKKPRKNSRVAKTADSLLNLVPETNGDGIVRDHRLPVVSTPEVTVSQSGVHAVIEPERPRKIFDSGFAKKSSFVSEEAKKTLPPEFTVPSTIPANQFKVFEYGNGQSLRVVGAQRVEGTTPNSQTYTSLLVELPIPEKCEVKRARPSMEEERICFQLKSVAGRVLTIMDAMIMSETQNTALKTLIKKEFRTQLNRVFKELHNDGGWGESESPEDKAARELEL